MSMLYIEVEVIIILESENFYSLSPASNPTSNTQYHAMDTLVNEVIATYHSKVKPCERKLG